MTTRLSSTSLGQQLALAAAGLCLAVSLAIVALAAISSSHVIEEQEREHGEALAALIAQRVSAALESGDLLSVSASLRRFVETSAVDSVVVTDIEGKPIGRAGDANAVGQSYSAPVRIDADVAGLITVQIGTGDARSAQNRFILSLLGLAILLSLAVYGGSRHFAQRLGGRLTRLAGIITLDEEDARARPANELELLARRIESLPMDLLRTRSEPGPQDENYQTTAVLYLQLNSLSDYVDTLDEQALHRYTDRLHQVVYAAAGFYAGELQVVRQFAVAVFFSGDNKAGSAGFRAASCAWLVRAVSRELERQMSLSMNISMAISQSELGAGDGADIYPGLYMQHTLDELQLVCTSKPPELLLSPAVCNDLDISSRLQFSPTELKDYALIEEFAGTYRDLLERQLRLILKKLQDPGSRR